MIVILNTGQAGTRDCSLNFALCNLPPSLLMEKKKPEHFIIGPNHFKEHVPIISKDEVNQEKQVENRPKTEENVAKSSAQKETQPQQESTRSEEKLPKISEKQTRNPNTSSAVSGFSVKGMQRKKEILERQLNKNQMKPIYQKNPLPR